MGFFDGPGGIKPENIKGSPVDWADSVRQRRTQNSEIQKRSHPYALMDSPGSSAPASTGHAHGAHPPSAASYGPVGTGASLTSFAVPAASSRAPAASSAASPPPSPSPSPLARASPSLTSSVPALSMHSSAAEKRSRPPFGGAQSERASKQHKSSGHYLVWLQEILNNSGGSVMEMDAVSTFTKLTDQEGEAFGALS